MTVLTVEKGGVVRRCNERCHLASSNKCRCVCGGLFHGAGIRGDLVVRVYDHLSTLAVELASDPEAFVSVTWPLVQTTFFELAQGKKKPTGLVADVRSEATPPKIESPLDLTQV